MKASALALALAREANRLWQECTANVTRDCPTDEQMAAALLKIIKQFLESK